MTIFINKKNIFPTLAVILFTLLLAFDPSNSLASAKDAIELVGKAVIPALFPFFVCSELLIALNVANLLGKLLNPIMKPIFKVNGAGALALVLGLISGYPTGAKTVVGLYESNSVAKEEGERLLGFCNNSGPLFILGAVGAGMLGRPDLGIVIYLSHFLSSISIGILFGIGKTTQNKKMPAPSVNKEQTNFGELLGNSIKKSVETVFMISGYVIIFNILIKGIFKFGITSHLLTQTLICGFFEPTSGARAASQLFQASPVLSLIMLSAVIGWAGVSVHLQVLSIISKSKLSPKKYFLGKFFHSIIAPIYTLILIQFMPIDKPVFFTINTLTKNNTIDITNLLVISVYYILLGLSMVLILWGLAWTYLIAKTILKCNSNAKL